MAPSRGSDLRALVLRYYEAFNDRDFDTYGSLLHDDVEVAIEATVLHGRAATLALQAEVLPSVPGVLLAPQRVLTHADGTVVAELRLVNPAPDEQPWRLAGAMCEILDLRDGQIVAIRSYYAAEPGDHTLFSRFPSRQEGSAIAAEQSALREVATLAARGVPEQELLAAVRDALTTIIGADLAAVLPIAALDGALGELAAPRRLDGPAELPSGGPLFEAARALELRSAIAVPITVGGRVWGAAYAATAGDAPFPEETEARIGGFTELLATALTNARSRAALQELADEQAALRRLAELVARGAAQTEVFDVIAREVYALLRPSFTCLARYEPDGSAVLIALHHAPPGIAVGQTVPSGDGVAQAVLRTGRPARLDDFATRSGPIGNAAREIGVATAAAAPIVVDGRVWGVFIASYRAGAELTLGLEDRLARFAEIAATAISVAHARGELQQRAEEQAALRRVAELVARGVGQAELFETVAREASGLIAGEGATMLRFDDDGATTIVATWGGPVPLGSRHVIDPDDLGITAQIRRTGRPGRLDSYAEIEGRAWAHDDFGVASTVAVPIVVEDRIWGVLGVTQPDRGLPVGAPGRGLPAGAEQRLQEFAELISAALANTVARAEVQQLADDQAALRRVAELAARGVSPEEVFEAVAVEASALVDGEAMTLIRLDADGCHTVMAVDNGPAPPGTVHTTDTSGVVAQIRATGRPFRIDDYAALPQIAVAGEFGLKACVGVPITVGDRTWGLLAATSVDRAMPPDTEHRLSQFAEIVGAAIANAESREQLRASRARVVATADETRRRVQRDVHDGAQQRLVQTVITLKLAREALGDGAGPAAELVDESLASAERATAELGDLVRGILPASLSRGGLRTGLESLISDLTLPIELQVDGQRLPAETETTAYFVVAEALTNVVKHAAATAVRVAVEVDDANVVIDVCDDGVGGADAVDGSGLTGLFDRVAARNGTLVIVSPPGAGTALRATLPLPRA